ncbi:MAG TPA: iron permease [Planctomycetaceae bacterium]|nr:iron permease [Planctomycetaceae bacterium]
MSIAGLLAVYCVLIAMASVGGGWLPAMLRMTHLRTQMLMSFVAGLMLGIATLHLLPHAMESLGSTSRTGAATLVGVIAMFLLLRAFHVHTHDVPVAIVPVATIATTDSQALSDQCEHGPIHSHSDGGSSPKPVRGLGWMGMLFGLGLHTIMDGVALGASVAADVGHGAWLGLAGLGTFLAVALHKPLDAFSISSVMASSGWSPTQRMLVNFAFSLCCPIGAGLFYFGATQLQVGPSVLGYGLALSAGFFICIALADLLPEVHFHDHDRGKLTVALLVGISLAVGIENLPGHSHNHDHDHLHDHLHDHGRVTVTESLSPADRFRARIRSESSGHHGHDHHGHNH